MWVNAPEIPGISYAAYRTPYGVVIPTGGRIAGYVRSGGVQEQDSLEIKGKLVTTMNEAFSRCRSGYGDIVVALNGHAENIAAADSWSNLVAGTKIIGLGTDADRPTFTWTAAASTVLINVANVSIDNLVMKCAGPGAGTALSVINPILISGSGCQINRCKIQAEVDTNEDSAICINTTAAADGLVIANSQIYGYPGAGTHVTTLLRLVGVDGFRMFNTLIDGFTSNGGVGVMEMNTTESLGIHVQDCTFVHRTAGSTVCVTGLAASTGNVVDCTFFKLGNDDIAIGTAWPTSTLMQFAGARICNLATENAANATTLST